MSEYIPIPYPRMLYDSKKAYRIVQDEAEELAAREEGWGDYGAPDPPSDAAPAPKNKGGRPRKNPEA
ncbi:MAG: hypothetical protein ABFE01_17380 [Phycisphaerales bacterium]